MSRKRYPLRVARMAHGIRAQSLRTLVRSAWWARRWVGSLEAMRLGARLGRGRQYAIAGQVTELVVEGPHVEASVTGSRPDPYRITLDFTAAQADCAAAAALMAEPMLLARLLTDDLPMEMEAMLKEGGVPLFPQAAPVGTDGEGRPVYDVKMRCSCPDWARPCKHLAAVLLLLGEEVARHPATLMALRGIDVEDFVDGDAPTEDADETPFEDFDANSAEARGAGDAAPLIRRLGAVPQWRGEVRCEEALARVYSRVRPVAAEAASGRSIDLRV